MPTLTATGIAPLLRLLGRYMALDEDDRRALSSLQTGPVCSREARIDIVREGENPTSIRLLISGWACRYKELPDGRRQIVGFFLPGDFCDLNIFILSGMDHSIGALTAVRFYEIQPQPFQDIIDQRNAKKCKLTARAAKVIARELGTIPPEWREAAIDLWLNKGWQGFFAESLMNELRRQPRGVLGEALRINGQSNPFADRDDAQRIPAIQKH
jgi:hypothetical protein